MKISIICTILVTICTSHMHASSFKVEKSKGKKQNAKTGITRLNKQSFELMMLESQNQEDDHMTQLADKIVLGAHSQIKGIDIHGHALNKKLRIAEKLILDFFWGTESLEILENYKQSGILFTDFIKDIIHTEENILAILTDITDFIEENPGVIQTHAHRIEKATIKLLDIKKNILDVLEAINTVFDKELL